MRNIESVTSIGCGAFYGCSGLVEMTLPFVGSSRTASGTYDAVFGYIFGYSSSSSSSATRQYYTGGSSYCYFIPTSLKKITITDTEQIPYGAFYNCSSLTNVTIPESVTSIGSYAFYGCSSLTAVNYNAKNCTSMGSYNYPVFGGCTALTTLNIGAEVKTIPEYAFNGCSGLESVTIPDSVTSIGSYAFYDCRGLESVYITNMVKYLNIDFGSNSANPMYYASKLYLNNRRVTKVEIPEGVTKIPTSAFDGCDSIKSVTIPESVTSIGERAFSGCSGLTSVTIPESVTGIGGSAFSGCSGLTSVTIPDSVTSIGRATFYGCSGLTSVTVPESVTSIGYEAFTSCRRLKIVTIPDNVTSIEGLAFSGCSGLESVTIPDSVTSIGYRTFYYCSGLESVTIPDSVTSIGESAFYGCSSLKSVNINDVAKWCGISFYSYDSNPLNYAHNLYLNGELVTDLVIPESVTSIGSYAFYGCSGLKTAVIGNGVTSVGDGAFAKCSSLASVTVGESVQTLGSSSYSFASVFYECGKLTNVNFNAVSCKTTNAFAGLKSISTVKLGDNVASLPEGIFKNCTGIKRLYIPKSLTEIEKDTFSGCSNVLVQYGGSKDDWDEMYIGAGNDGLLENVQYNVTLTDSGYSYITNTDGKGVTVTGIYSGTGEISVPSEINGLPVTAIGTRAFNGRTALTKVIIPETVQSIGEEAFRGCSALQTVSIGTGVTSIERYAFYECPKLNNVIYQGSEDEWNEITILGGNDQLTNVHRSIGALKPLPLSPIRAERAGGDDVLSYNVYVDKTYDNSTVYEAVYDISGRLLAAGKAAMSSTGAANVTVPNAAGAAGVKIFVWKDAHQPVSEAALPGLE